MECILDARLLLLHFDFGRCADIDLSNAARELGETLLELLTVVVAGGHLDLSLEELDAGLNVLGLAGAFDDGGRVLADGDLLGAAEFGDGDVLELDAEFFHDRLTADNDAEILKQFLTTIAEARSLDGTDLDDATELVHDESRECFAIDILSDDEKALAALGDLAEDRKEVLRSGNLLLVKEDIAILEHALHGRVGGDEVRAEVALVELHAFEELDMRVEGLAFLNGDDAVLADLVHGFGDDVADLHVLVG